MKQAKPASPERRKLITDMTLSVLRALPLIEHHGSITKAAKILGISQPAISRGISLMETRLGVSLLRRGSRPMQLTDEGAILAGHADRMDAMLAATLAQVEDKRRHRTGRVRIGSFGASASTRLLPEYLRDFARHYPDIRVQIHELPDQNIAAALRDGQVDIALMVEPHSQEFDTIPLTADQLIALVQSDDPLATRPHLTAEDLSKRSFIMTKGGSEPIVRQWFEQNDHALTIDHTIQQLTSILAMVRAGLGVSIIAELAVPESHDDVSIIPLHPSAPRRICFARLPSGMSSHAAETFWEYYENQTI